MCGICGIYNLDKATPVAEEILGRMTDALTHRGPDDRGIYLNGFIGLGHRRLSIIDLQSGRQPMTNEDGTVWTTYNGELYNFRELRSCLLKKGHVFKTNCDTEVIIHAYEEYGSDCVLKFNGMFAFAIWDIKSGVLFLARDRLGIKPLYYTVKAGSFIFGSEIKSLFEHPAVNIQVEPNSILEYLFCTSILNGKTMFRDIATLPAGHTMVVKNGIYEIIEYWDVKLEDCQNDTTPAEHFKERIFDLLNDSVRLRLMSDVPYGSLLSGGLDSSLISALASTNVDRPLKTFSIEFEENVRMNRSASDTEFANLMATAFHTEHREFILPGSDYTDIHEKVVRQIEKPVELTSPSLYLLHKNLKDYITVVLSGEGADELFGGYFFFLEEARANLLTEFPWAPYFDEISELINDDMKKETGFRENIIDSLNKLFNKFKTDDFINRVLYLFIKVYLLEMLERQDKASMAWGVETRVPFLDHRLVEYVANIPSRYKIKDDIEKYILKESFRNFIPSAVLDRKKKPFPFPVDPKSVVIQRNTANDLIQSGKSRISAYFDKRKTYDFFKKKNRFEKIDNLAIFRTSYAMIALEQWHKVFGV
jgi:asparagine synthase (glutamine-hydrolysing)